jgi:hypothetical protein
MTGTRRLGIAAHVLRCSVASLDSRAGVQYRGALRFDHRCEGIWEGKTLDGYLFPNPDLAADVEDGQSLPDAPDPDPVQKLTDPE